MNDKDNFQILRNERTKLVNEIADLQTENAQLREAAIHFQYCRECAEDGLCWLGRQHDDFLSSLNERKAV